MLLIALLHVLSQEPPPPTAMPPPPVPIPSLPAGARERRPEFEIGRSSAGNLVYHGRFTLEGVEVLRSMIRPNDTVAVSGVGGDLAVGLKIARLVNAADGSLRMAGSCFRECAAMATVADRFVVPRGGTLLFTRSSLLAAGNDAARALAACIPSTAPDGALAWFAPEVIAGAGLSNIRMEWTVATGARESYERLVAGAVVWIDVC